ncbi:MAG TPA: hypothetical protein VOA80_16045, partial [Thermoanaerobaculia bacterium]|nr:hypothetical protein [Thermoanaerobaculia bacterium]
CDRGAAAAAPAAVIAGMPGPESPAAGMGAAARTEMRRPAAILRPHRLSCIVLLAPAPTRR